MGRRFIALMYTLLIVIVLTVVLLAAALSFALRRPSPRDDDVAGPYAESDQESLSDLILELVDESVLVVDHSLTLTRANKAARSLFGIGEVLPPALPSDDLLSAARRVVAEQQDVEEVIQLRTPTRRTLHLWAHPLRDTEGAVLVLRDVSDDHRSQLIRRQFVTHASHELKSPIAAIQLLAEAVSDASENDPIQTRRFAQSLLSEAQRLTRLVTDLLDLSQVEDPATITNSIADLSATTTAEIAEVSKAASSKSITIIPSIQEGVSVRGDERQLALMVRNLLDNAVRYTSEGGRISVSVDAEENEAVLKVADTGVGIPLRDQSRVFERFYRVDQGRSRGEGGTGLGLAIVKHVADLHGGHVSLWSQLGEGSTFTVVLPVAQAPSESGDLVPQEAV